MAMAKVCDVCGKSPEVESYMILIFKRPVPDDMTFKQMAELESIAWWDNDLCPEDLRRLQDACEAGVKPPPPRKKD